MIISTFGEILRILQEMSYFSETNLEWNKLVKKTITGFTNVREYQLLWRHLSYHHPLPHVVDDAQPLVIQAHSPIRKLVNSFGYKLVVAAGKGEPAVVMSNYGFKNVISMDEYASYLDNIDPLAPYKKTYSDMKCELEASPVVNHEEAIAHVKGVGYLFCIYGLLRRMRSCSPL